MISESDLAGYQARAKSKRLLSEKTTRVHVRLIPTEEQEQIALFDWIRLKGISCAYAVPNGGFRNAREAARLVQAGVLAGTPDVHVCIARRGAHSLYIELKALDGTPSVHQIERAIDFAEAGNVVAFCWGFEDARKVLEWYLL